MARQPALAVPLARASAASRAASAASGQEKLLPYVAPTTDWIRLQRRIPVTIALVDPPPDSKLYMGADARTVSSRDEPALRP